MNLKFDPAKFETAASHAGKTFEHGLNTVAHLVAALAPVAQAVGTVIGNPAVVAGATAASQVAAVAEQATEQPQPTGQQS